MTWLKTFGLEVLKIIGVVTGVLSGGQIQQAFPGAAGTINTVDNDLTDIATIVQDVEVAFAGASASGVAPLPAQTGPLKLAAATPLVAAKISASAMMKGQKVKDQPKYAAAVKGITSNMADLLNSLDPQSIKVEKA